ncbi:hypothetical protein ACWGH3_10030 [Streptomyces sp. NPDC054884]|uniref:hypothetical protein n=1 Tax=Streptomyces sp. ME08-AFT2 TaxID=3028683 RepID=UPI0029BF232A|nr:hypothetical protein [Streptomyces sp. ME08-AFT2]MDX3309188.1 hypothetical protein [Streptomyces sp. ME08-AFT2]
MTLADLLASVALTARLGPVHVGASWDDVTAALGEPREVVPVSRRSRSRRQPRLFGYGDLEVFVCPCREVRMVSVQTWTDTVELPGHPGTFPGEPAHAEIVAALDRAACPWELDPGLTFRDQRTLRIPSTRAAFTFVVPEAGEPTLHALGLADDDHTCPSPSRPTS